MIYKKKINHFVKDLTFIIVTYRSNHIIKKCLSGLPAKSKIIIVENSNDINLKKHLKKNKNLKIILNKNGGYGHGNNVGLNKVTTKYAFIINPDVLIKKNAINIIYNAVKLLKDDFSIIGPINTKLNSLKNKITNEKTVSGHAMLLNLKNKILFDEKIFLFYDEIDFCMRVKKKGGKIFSVDGCNVIHKGRNSVKYSFKVEVLRNWHYYWSHFYFHKKHFGLPMAYIKSSKKFFGSLSQYFFAVILFREEKRIMNKYKFLGLVCSILSKPASLRLEHLTRNF